MTHPLAAVPDAREHAAGHGPVAPGSPVRALRPSTPRSSAAMPELPEAEAARALVEAHCVGKVIKEVVTAEGGGGPRAGIKVLLARDRIESCPACPMTMYAAGRCCV